MAALNLPRLGKVVEKYMLDVVQILRRSGQATDPNTLVVTDTYAVLYTGKGFVTPIASPNNPGAGSDPMNQSIGDTQITRIDYEIAVPLAAGDFDPGDRVVLVSAYDPDLLGKIFIVTGPIPSTFASHRRLSAYMDQVVP